MTDFDVWYKVWNIPEWCIRIRLVKNGHRRSFANKARKRKNRCRRKVNKTFFTEPRMAGKIIKFSAIEDLRYIIQK